MAKNKVKSDKKTKKKRRLRRLICVIISLAVLISAFFIWSVGTAYKPTDEAKAVFSSTQDVRVIKEDFGCFFDGARTDTAIIFYPGARVEYECYSPLLYRIAQSGIDCFAVKMPCNLAFFGMNAADGIMEKYHYEHYYISGHSLGGAMAASYASENIEKLDGIILLAAYPTSELKRDGFTVISIYGSEDGVLNFEKLEKGRQYMPENYHEVCIEGGNHAWFGSYGEQNGDGTAKITHEEQWNRTVEAINKFIV